MRREGRGEERGSRRGMEMRAAVVGGIAGVSVLA
jgi:hypothetical protein